MKGDFTTREEIYDVYQKRARIYDLAVYGCYLLGFPIGRYRRLVIEALAPRPGDTIIEIGCGQGDFLSLYVNWAITVDSALTLAMCPAKITAGLPST